MSNNLTDLPEGWRLIKLDELFRWSNGKGLTKQQMEDGSYFVYGGNGITGTHSQWLCDESAIVVGRVGAQCGNVHLAQPHSWITDNAIYTSWKTNYVCLEFFTQLLANLKLNELAGGSGQPYVSQTILNPLLVPLPPLNEQKRIVAKIEELRDRHQTAKQALEAVPKLCDRFRQSVLAAAFRGDLTADWREENPDVEPAHELIERSTAQIVHGKETGRAATINIIPGRAALSVGDTETAVPKNWCRVPLLKIARLESGHTPSRKHPEYWDGDIPWIGIVDAREHHGGHIFNTRQYTNEDGLANSAARLLPKDTVCLSRTASVGYVVIMGRTMATSQDFVNWVCSRALIPEFLMYALLAEGEHLLKFGKGTTHTTIYFPEVKSLHITLPPLEEQKEIVHKVSLFLKRISGLEEQYPIAQDKLDRLNQAVLAKAFRGELVEQDPSDEPASVLLDRIRAEREQAGGKTKEKGKRGK